MYQNPLAFSSAKSFDPVMLTEMALRSAEQLACMNVSATGVILQTQASAATVLGLPDLSPMIAATTEQARQVVTASTDQFLSAAHQASEVMTAFQRSTSELMGEHSAKASEALRTGMEELGAQTRDSMEKFSSASQQFASHAASMASDVLDEMPRPDMALSPLSEAVQGALPPEGDPELRH